MTFASRFGFITVIAVLLPALSVSKALAQTDEQAIAQDGGSTEVLQSIHVPLIKNSPFSLTLATEWARPMGNGGHFTVVNTRPIKRDHLGRLYEERWLLSPKGGNIPSRMSYIQIADPSTRTLYNCNVGQHVCEELTLSSSETVLLAPSSFKSAPLPDGKGSHLHEDLGAQYFAGVPVHEYRDTTTINAGVLGNDLPMVTVRQFRYSAELGINLSSELDNPQSGHQTFTVTEISTTEPDPAFFQVPDGYKVVDHRTKK
jgi:hypothetical protein